MVVYYTHMFASLMGLLVNIIVQLLSYRLVGRVALLQSVFVGFFSGLVVVVTIEAVYFTTTMLLLQDIIGYMFVNVIAYTGFGYCYFHFINLGETARRIRILRELWEAQIGLSLSELLQRYNATEIIEHRLQRMMRNRQVIETDGRFYIGNRMMLYLAKAVLLMKQILLGKQYADLDVDYKTTKQ